MRYRKLSTRLWADERFRRLSGPQPNAQSLFIYLMTGPHTSNIPGLFVAGEASLAEALGWPVEGFRKAFRELFAEGFGEGHTYPLVAADLDARLIFLPRAIRHNPPENPNVVKSWKEHWAELPECGLKDAAWHVFLHELQEKSDACAKAFEAHIEKPKGSRKPFGKAFAYPMPKGMANQEQEQEQEQIKNLAPPKSTASADGKEKTFSLAVEPSKPKRGRPPKDPEAHAAERADADRWMARVRDITGLGEDIMCWSQGHFLAWKALRKKHGIETLMLALDGLESDKFYKRGNLGLFVSANAVQSGVAAAQQRRAYRGQDINENWERIEREQAGKAVDTDGW